MPVEEITQETADAVIEDLPSQGGPDDQRAYRVDVRVAGERVVVLSQVGIKENCHAAGLGEVMLRRQPARERAGTSCSIISNPRRSGMDSKYSFQWATEKCGES